MKRLLTVLCIPILSSCSVGMALSGAPDPDFQGFEIGSSRQIVERQLGRAVFSKSMPDNTTEDTYRFEVGNSSNGHRALLNLYLDLATFGLYELIGTPIELAVSHQEETRILYSKEGTVLAIRGYDGPILDEASKAAVAEQEKQIELMKTK